MTMHRIEIRAERFGSLEDVRRRASFSVLTPTRLPAAAQLVRIDYYVLPGREDEPKNADWVKLFYETSDGRYFMIRQGSTPDPYSNETTPSDARGEATVQGGPARWVDGTSSPRNAAGARDAWRRGIFSLGWHPATESDSDAPRSYVIEALTSQFALDDLLEIAESVR